MDAFLILPQYFSWHYKRGFYDLYGIILSVLLSVAGFFAFETIVSTFGTSLIGAGPASVSTSVLSGISRFAHACVQIFLFLVGFAFLIAGIVVGLCVSVVWLVYPFLILWLFVMGVIRII